MPGAGDAFRQLATGNWQLSPPPRGRRRRGREYRSGAMPGVRPGTRCFVLLATPLAMADPVNTLPASNRHSVAVPAGHVHQDFQTRRGGPRRTFRQRTSRHKYHATRPCQGGHYWIFIDRQSSDTPQPATNPPNPREFSPFPTMLFVWRLQPKGLPPRSAIVQARPTPRSLSHSRGSKPGSQNPQSRPRCRYASSTFCWFFRPAPVARDAVDSPPTTSAGPASSPGPPPGLAPMRTGAHGTPRRPCDRPTHTPAPAGQWCARSSRTFPSFTPSPINSTFPTAAAIFTTSDFSTVSGCRYFRRFSARRTYSVSVAFSSILNVANPSAH